MRGTGGPARAILACVASVLALFVVGCGGRSGPALAPVSGTITYKGKAVEGANVAFIPSGTAPRSATGQTDAQGNFKLTTFDTNDGAVLGEHTITISKPEASAASQVMDASNPGADYDAAMRAISPGGGGSGKKAEWMPTTLPDKYSKKETSPLKRTVAEGENNFKIQLED